MTSSRNIQSKQNSKLPEKEETNKQTATDKKQNVKLLIILLYIDGTLLFK